MKPRGEDRGEHDARLLAGVDDRVAAAERDFQRLLDDDVLARPRGGHGRLQMGPAGRADGDDVHRRVGQHLVELVIGLAAGRRGQFVGGGGHWSKQATSLAPRTSPIALAWNCDHPATNYAEPEHDENL